MSPSGIVTVARLELMQRFRGPRWWIAFAAWFLLITGIFGLTWWSMRSVDGAKGATTFDIILFFVLGLSLLIMPALTATSVNGDRDAGVLATLQTTLLSAADIIVGKLLASLVMALTFVALTLPYLLIAFVQGGVDLPAAVRVLVVLVVILIVVCATGLMFSTLTARPVGSAVLTYLTVSGMCILTTVFFAMSFPLVTHEEETRVYGVPPTVDVTPTECEEYTSVESVSHTERTWILLGLNPFVIVADAGPSDLEDISTGDAASGFTPMRYISYGTRMAKAGPPEVEDRCWAESSTPPGTTDRVAQEGPAWTYGIGLHVLLGIGATLVAIRRVRTPIGRLPGGTRVA